MNTMLYLLQILCSAGTAEAANSIRMILQE